MTKPLRELIIETFAQYEKTFRDWTAEKYADTLIAEKALEEKVPPGAEVVAVTGYADTWLLMSTGLLKVRERGLKTLLIPFREIRELQLKNAIVTVRKNDPAAGGFGFGYKSGSEIILCDSHAEAKDWHDKLYSMLNQSPSASVSDSSESSLDKLLKLKQLLDLGAISEDEFQAQKEKLLD